MANITRHDNMTHLTMTKDESVVVAIILKVVGKEPGGDL